MAVELSLSTFFDLPRLGGLTCAPDGSRLITSVQTRSPDGPVMASGASSESGSRQTSMLWELPLVGGAEVRQLPWSVDGDGAPVFLADGSLVFLSGRGDEARGLEPGVGRLWVMLDDAPGPEPVAEVPGGILAMSAAGKGRAVIVRALVHGGSEDLAADADKERLRAEAGTTGLLHEEYPIRWWDQALGPRTPRLLKVDLDASGADRIRDLTGDVGRALFDVYGGGLACSPDGETVFTNWRRQAGKGFGFYDLVAVGPENRRVLASGERDDFFLPAASPDGRYVVAMRRRLGAPEEVERWTLWVIDLESGEGSDLTPGFDLWPQFPVWSADSMRVFFTAEERGRVPAFTVDLRERRIDRVAGDAAFGVALCPSPDGQVLFTTRSGFDEPEVPVRIDIAGGSVTELSFPREEIVLPGRVTEVETRADDGVAVRGWLVVPVTASPDQPAPLVTWIHGGPIGTWTGWNWRWNPHLLAAEGYAVLLPDPAQSTGYGQAFIERGWGAWGERPFRDVMSLVDAAAALPEIDGERTAAMGSSFGGYMVNWIAGHTGRFDALVVISGIYALDQMHGTSDSWLWSEAEFGDPYVDPSRFLGSSPHLSVGQIRTPMLVVHGERDYRVPIDQALRLWTDLQRHEVPSRLLLFPDEGHFIMRPGNLDVFYRTVFAFFDEQLRGRPWTRPTLL